MKQVTKLLIATILCVVTIFSFAAFSGCSNGNDKELNDIKAKLEEIEKKNAETEKKLKEAEDNAKKALERLESLTIGGTDNIDYRLSDDGTYYIATGPVEDCTDTVFEIATLYKGLPVKEIAESAFAGLNEENVGKGEATCVIKNVTIPSSVTYIGKKAFENDSQLAYVYFGGAVDGGDEVLSGCTSLTQVTISEGTKRIPNGFFRNLTGMVKCVLPEGLEEIGDGAFFNCCNQNFSINIPSTVKKICFAAFWNAIYTNFETFPADTVEYIGAEAFFYCVRAKFPNIKFGSQLKFIGAKAFYLHLGEYTIEFEQTDGWYYTSDENADATTEGSIAIKLEGDCKELLYKYSSEEEGCLGEYYFKHD